MIAPIALLVLKISALFWSLPPPLMLFGLFWVLFPIPPASRLLLPSFPIQPLSSLPPLGLGTAAAPAVMAEWFPGLCESGPVVLSLVGVPMQDLGSLPSLGLGTAAAPVCLQGGSQVFVSLVLFWFCWVFWRV